MFFKFFIKNLDHKNFILFLIGKYNFFSNITFSKKVILFIIIFFIKLIKIPCHPEYPISEFSLNKELIWSVVPNEDNYLKAYERYLVWKEFSYSLKNFLEEFLFYYIILQKCNSRNTIKVGFILILTVLWVRKLNIISWFYSIILPIFFFCFFKQLDNYFIL